MDRRPRGSATHSLLLESQDNPKDNGSTNDGGDDIDGNDALLAWQGADEIAGKGQRRTRQQGGRQEGAVVGTAQEEPSDVGHSQSNKGNRAAEGCGGSGEQACGEEQKRTSARDTDTQITGIIIAQKQGIEGFNEQD